VGLGLGLVLTSGSGGGGMGPPDAGSGGGSSRGGGCGDAGLEGEDDEEAMEYVAGGRRREAPVSDKWRAVGRELKNRSSC